jgi:hypothetical protein
MAVHVSYSSMCVHVCATISMTTAYFNQSDNSGIKRCITTSLDVYGNVGLTNHPRKSQSRTFYLLSHILVLKNLGHFFKTPNDDLANILKVGYLSDELVIQKV